MERYRVGQVIGHGTYGTVILAYEIKSGEKVAIKKMKKKFLTWEECIELREVKALRKINHPNVIRLKELFRENDMLFLVFEHMSCNLYELIKGREEPFSDNLLRNWFFQVLRGLAFVHKHGFFHRDLKPENLLLSGADFDVLKIADFGLAREISSSPPYTQYISTRWYRAPEVLFRGTYSTPTDLWAVGAIMAEVFSLRPLFPGRNEADQIVKIAQILGTPKHGNWPHGVQLAMDSGFTFPEDFKPQPLEKVIRFASPEARRLIADLINYDPLRRPSANQAMQYPYFTEALSVPRNAVSQLDRYSSQPGLPPMTNNSAIQQQGGGSIKMVKPTGPDPQPLGPTWLQQGDGNFGSARVDPALEAWENASGVEHQDGLMRQGWEAGGQNHQLNRSQHKREGMMPSMSLNKPPHYGNPVMHKGHGTISPPPMQPVIENQGSRILPHGATPPHPSGLDNGVEMTLDMGSFRDGQVFPPPNLTASYSLGRVDSNHVHPGAIGGGAAPSPRGAGMTASPPQPMPVMGGRIPSTQQTMQMMERQGVDRQQPTVVIEQSFVGSISQLHPLGETHMSQKRAGGFDQSGKLPHSSLSGREMLRQGSTAFVQPQQSQPHQQFPMTQGNMPGYASPQRDMQQQFGPDAWMGREDSNMKMRVLQDSMQDLQVGNGYRSKGGADVAGPGTMAGEWTGPGTEQLYGVPSLLHKQPTPAYTPTVPNYDSHSGNAMVSNTPWRRADLAHSKSATSQPMFYGNMNLDSFHNMQPQAPPFGQILEQSMSSPQPIHVFVPIESVEQTPVVHNRDDVEAVGKFNPLFDSGFDDVPDIDDWPSTSPREKPDEKRHHPHNFNNGGRPPWET